MADTKFHIKMESQVIGGELCVAEDIQGQVTIQRINLKEKAVRESLIKLGWIPPDVKGDKSKELVKDMQWLADNLNCDYNSAQIWTLQAFARESVKKYNRG